MSPFSRFSELNGRVSQAVFVVPGGVCLKSGHTIEPVFLLDLGSSRSASFEAALRYVLSRRFGEGSGDCQIQIVAEQLFSAAEKLAHTAHQAKRDEAWKTDILRARRVLSPFFESVRAGVSRSSSAGQEIQPLEAELLDALLDAYTWVEWCEETQFLKACPKRRGEIFPESPIFEQGCKGFLHHVQEESFA